MHCPSSLCPPSREKMAESAPARNQSCRVQQQHPWHAHRCLGSTSTNARIAHIPFLVPSGYSSLKLIDASLAVIWLNMSEGAPTQRHLIESSRQWAVLIIKLAGRWDKGLGRAVVSITVSVVSALGHLVSCPPSHWCSFIVNAAETARTGKQCSQH